MMKLDLMQAVLSEKTAAGEVPFVNRVLDNWAHEPGGATFVRASANFVFSFKDAGRTRFLRLTNANQRTLDQILAEVTYVKFLHSRGLHVARIISTIRGEDLVTLNAPYGDFYVVAFEGLRGGHLGDSVPNPVQFARWGAALGALHNAASTCETQAPLVRPTWSQILGEIDAQLPASEGAARAECQRLAADMANWTSSRDNFGLIHGDFELDNLLWSDKRPGMIDFDDCMIHWFSADIAFSIGRWLIQERGGFDTTDDAAIAFLSGYRTQRAIEPEDLACIPVHLRFHNLMKFARLLTAVTPPGSTGEFAWMPALREKLVVAMQACCQNFV